MEPHFYIARGQATQGPLSLADLESYLAYGSIADMDLVKREGSEEWVPISSLPEIQETHDAKGKNGSRTRKPRRRTARYRDYQRVPLDQRAGTALRRIFFGFLFWPPALWKGGATIFADYIYRKAKDESGYLRIWPRWVEAFVSILIVVNLVAWAAGGMWITHHAAPVAREVGAVVRDGMREFEGWLNAPAVSPPEH